MRKLIPLLALVLLIGCVNATYKTLYAVSHGVDTAYSGYLDLVVKGQVRTNGVPEISREYNLFQVMAGAAVQLASNAPPNTVIAPTNVTVQAAQVLSAIAVERSAKK